MELFASIVEALAAEFPPYTEHVIPPLIRSRQKQTMVHRQGLGGQRGALTGAEETGTGHQQDFGGILFHVETPEVNEKSMAVCLEGALLQFVELIIC